MSESPLQTVYQIRRRKEQLLAAEAEEVRSGDFLSGNKKTGYSLNFPISNCQPTKTCSTNCYACSGPIAFKMSILKSLSIEKTLETDIDYAVNKTALEIQKLRLDNLRYSGGGDLSDYGISFIMKLADRLPDVIFWGFTRKINALKALHNARQNIKVIYSLDKTTRDSIRDEVLKDGYKTSFLYESENTVPDNAFVVFANHAKGHLDGSLPRVAHECPAIRDHVTVCNNCRKCFSFI